MVLYTVTGHRSVTIFHREKNTLQYSMLAWFEMDAPCLNAMYLVVSYRNSIMNFINQRIVLTLEFSINNSSKLI